MKSSCLVLLVALIQVIYSPALSRAELRHPFRIKISLQENSAFHRHKSAQVISDFSAEVERVLRKTAFEMEKQFGLVNPPRLTVEFLPEKEFYLKTKAPRWTTGVSLGNQMLIIIPESPSALRREELEKTLKHEYVHAAIAHNSGTRSPAWLDEGLAQLAEGSTPQAARTASLVKFTDRRGCIPLAQLGSGFTRFRTNFVPFAYSYSLFATERLLLWTKPRSLKPFFNKLAAKTPLAVAFKDSFGIGMIEFERRLHRSLGCNPN